VNNKNNVFVFLLFCLFNVSNINAFFKKRKELKSNYTTLHIDVKKINTNNKERYFCSFLNRLFTTNNNSPPE
jgi:hypothetical protein